MSPTQDAIVIAIDIGRSVSKPDIWGKKAFFEQARSCVSWIIQRKLISQSKDLLSLMLIGSKETDNVMTISGYNNICCKFDFQRASWDMLTFIEKEVKPTDNESDWIGALIVSMEMLRNYEFVDNIQNRKIVFFSNFEASGAEDLENIAKNLKSLNIEITVIGPDCILPFPESDEFEEPPVKKKRSDDEEDVQNENMIYKLWKIVPDHVVICSFESALKQLCSYIRKLGRATPWNCILDIGDVKINISMFKKTDPKNSKKFTTKSFKSKEVEPDSGIGIESMSTIEIASTIRDKVLLYKHQEEEGKDIVDIEVKAEDTIEGFRYGTTIIPFSVEDKAVMEYKSGPKSFSVIGFTNISSVPYYLLSGECSYIVVPRDKDQNAEVALSALIQAMKKLECLAVVRRVYSENRGLSLGILYPMIEEIDSDGTDDQIICKEYLLFVELAFQEEIKSINFPSLEHLMSKISQSQLDVIDNLIDGMNLMKADRNQQGELSEAFDFTSLHDFKEQFFHYCVIQRGLNPENPLPTSLPICIQDFVKIPKFLDEKRKLLVEDLKSNFKIEAKKDSSLQENLKLKTNTKSENTNASFSSVQKTENRESKEKEIEHFSELSLKEERNPVKYKLMRLFKKRLPSNFEIDNFLADLLEEDEVEKLEINRCFKEVVSQVRQIYLTTNPDKFNDWINKFKAFAYESGEIELEIWHEIASEKMGLISEAENKTSRVLQVEAENFLSEKIPKCFSAKNKNPSFESFDNLISESINDLRAEQMECDSLF